MRNYIELFFAKAHVHKDSPLVDADIEMWRGTAEELDSRIAQQRNTFESAGYTFTLLLRMPAYFNVDRKHLVTFITDIAQSLNLVATSKYTDGDEPFIQFDSPRRQETRKFYLVPIKKKRSA